MMTVFMELLSMCLSRIQTMYSRWHFVCELLMARHLVTYGASFWLFTWPGFLLSKSILDISSAAWCSLWELLFITRLGISGHHRNSSVTQLAAAHCSTQMVLCERMPTLTSLAEEWKYFFVIGQTCLFSLLNSWGEKTQTVHLVTLSLTLESDIVKMPLCWR